MKLIVGLGNPGKEYERTRHNAGFRAVRAYHAAHAAEFDGWKKKFDAEISEGRIGGEKIALLLPQTFMNLSGDAVAQAAEFWKIAAADVVLVYDELDIPVGALRVRPGGSAGGHNGVKSVIERLGTDTFARIRIGIKGAMAGRVPAEKYVLEPFATDEETAISGAIKNAVAAIDAVITRGVDAAMNDYNG